MNWGAGIMDRMAQNNIQILSILLILSEIFYMNASSRRVPIGARPAFCASCVRCLIIFQTLIYTDSELLLHKLYILTAMAEPHQSPKPPPASQSTRAPSVTVFGWGALLLDHSGRAEGRRSCDCFQTRIHSR